eukprot:2666945-Prymnesium_polylepis.1
MLRNVKPSPGTHTHEGFIRAHEGSSGLIKAHQPAHQGSLALITRDRAVAVAALDALGLLIRAHQDSSGLIRAHQRSSPVIAR